MWFTETNAYKIARVDPTSGTIREFDSCRGPEGIVSAGGYLWVSCYLDHDVAKVDTAGDIVATLPLGIAPAQMGLGLDGNLWLGSPDGGGISRLTLSGVETRFSTHGGAVIGWPAVGPDGDVWFSDPGANEVGTVTGSSAQGAPEAVTGYAPTGATAGYDGMAAGPDGRLWVAEGATGKLAAISPRPPGTPPGGNGGGAGPPGTGGGGTPPTPVADAGDLTFAASWAGIGKRNGLQSDQQATQFFAPSRSGGLTSVRLYLARTQTAQGGGGGKLGLATGGGLAKPAGGVIATSRPSGLVVTISGVDADGRPGTQLATTTLADTSIPASAIDKFQWVDVDLPMPVHVTAGSHYAITASAPDGWGYLWAYADTSQKAVYPIGSGTLDANGTWSTSSQPLTFSTNLVPATTGPATPTLGWNPPTDIPYGLRLGPGQLDVVATDATGNPLTGTTTYVPAAGTVLDPGPHMLSATFEPTDTADYGPATAGTGINVNPVPLSFDTADTAAATTASPFTFTAVVVGAASETITESGALPDGVAFKDNGDGTATLSGTPAKGSAGTYPLHLVARTGTDSVDQAFSLTVANPPAPGFAAGTKVTTSTIQASGFTVAWTAPSWSGTAYIDHYSVQVAPTGTGAWKEAARTTGTVAALDGLVPATAYDVQVVPVDDFGDGGVAAAGSATTAAGPGFAAGSDKLSFFDVGNFGFTASWPYVAPGTGAVHIDHYDVLVQGPDDKAPRKLATALAGGTTVSIPTGLIPGTTYTVTVQPVDNLGTSSGHAATGTVTMFPPPGFPDSANTLEFPKTTQGGFTVKIPQFGYISDDWIHHFDIEVKGPGESAWRTVGRLNVTDGLTSVVTGLDPNTTYSVQVVPIDSVGVAGSPASGTVTTAKPAPSNLNGPVAAAAGEPAA
ncbi:MAG TPA: fibronectin type III domain-containing protein, partial [Acidimicrobiales bacterium]|nr:fibronectin type III domain-containing protein [Acidimicrobiales bacterium]